MIVQNTINGGRNSYERNRFFEWLVEWYAYFKSNVSRCHWLGRTGHLKDIREVRQQRDIIYEVKRQFLIEVACKELENIIDNCGTDLVNRFRKAMEEYMNYA